MKYYYLLNGKIMSANEKMPDNGFDYTTWFYSLQPCEISESELEKIISELNNSRIIYPRKNELIEVTDMIRTEEIKTITKSGTITDYKFFFKHPKQVDVEIEAVGYVAILHGRIISGIYKSYDRLKEDYPNTEHCKLTTLQNIKK